MKSILYVGRLHLSLFPIKKGQVQLSLSREGHAGPPDWEPKPREKHPSTQSVPVHLGACADAQCDLKANAVYVLTSEQPGLDRQGRRYREQEENLET